MLLENELDELSKEVEEISITGLTKDLINKFSIFNGAKYFPSGIFQNYLVFIPVKKYVKYFTGITWTDSSKSNGMSEKNIKNMAKSNRNFTPTFADLPVLSHINFNGHYLINNNVSISKKVILYI